MPEYQAVLVDLDGTLLGADSRVSARTLEVLAEVERRGVRVMVATGRSVVATRTAVGEARTWETEWCCYNGAVIVDSRSGEWRQHQTLCDQACAAAIEALMSAGLDVIVQHDDRKFVPPPQHPAFEEILGIMKAVNPTPRAELPSMGVTRVSACGDTHTLRETLRMVDEAHPGVLELLHFPLGAIPGFEAFEGVGYCDVQPAGGGKAEGMQYLQRTHGIPPERAIAIGDHLNDVSMIDAAGLGVAMANAPEEVRARADRVIGRHDEDGVADFLAQVLLD